MDTKGYWVECIPINGKSNQNFGADLYNASIDSFPDMKVSAATPDMAVQKLRDKLAKVKKYYEMTGRALPEAHNPIMPTNKMRDVKGWMSIYVKMTD